MRIARTTSALLTAGLLLVGCDTGGTGTDGTATTGTTGTAEQPPLAQGAAERDPDGAAGRDGITVTGVGEVTGRPDVLRAIVGVEVIDDSVQAAMDTASERAEAVATALRDAGVDGEDIQTQDVTVRRARPERPPEPGAAPAPEQRPYVAENRLDVRIRDVERAGEVLQAAVDAGGDAARLRVVRFDVEDDDQLLADARERAFADARDKAEQYARLAGRELGELRALHEGRATPHGLGPFPEDAAAAPPAAVPVEPGTEHLTVRVTAVWSLD